MISLEEYNQVEDEEISDYFAPSFGFVTEREMRNKMSRAQSNKLREKMEVLKKYLGSMTANYSKITF